MGSAAPEPGERTAASGGYDAFHPDLSTVGGPERGGAPRTRVHHIRAEDLDAGTAQTPGMRRLAAITGKRVSAEKIWMGQTHVSVRTSSGNHHHGDSETAIYVVSGHPEFVFAEGVGDSVEEVRIKTSPGDYIFVPPFVPHREENPGEDEEAVVVIARSTQEAIVINLPRLYALDPSTGAPPTGA
jgi:uncharacterized RmlC-like cupin family protein